MLDPEKIRKEGMRIIDEFSDKLKNVPETEETHYVMDLRNVTRPDSKPVRTEGFTGKMEKLAPKWSEGHVVAEKGQ
ncbi:MAG: Asp-tRNA(Asn) amidotransferase subunit GatC [Candidatus Altiarchaeota archaeon]